MSSDAKLPPYSEGPSSKGRPVPSPQTTTHGSIASNVQTCSIKDLQFDYLKIVRESATSAYICLTVDPTPLYRIEFVEDSTKVGDIQIFSAPDTSLPAIAAARLSTENKSRSKQVAMICTSKPYLPDAHWRPVTRAGVLSLAEDYRSSIPIVTVPGTAPTYQQFGWRTSLCEPLFELWWDGPYVNAPPYAYVKDQRDSRYLLATVVRRSAETGNIDNLVEIRRGGGLEFELSVILEMLVILHHKKQQLV